MDQNMAAPDLVFPKSLFKRSQGFSIDFGSSCIKIVHTTDDGDNLVVHFTTFSGPEFEAALTFLQEVSRGLSGPDATVHVTGVGGSLHLEKIQQALNVRLAIISEGETFCSGLRFISKHKSRAEAFHAPSQNAIDVGAVRARQFATVFCSVPGKNFTPWDYMRDIQENEDKVRAFTMPDEVEYPVIAANIGSGFAVGKLHADGIFECCNLWSTPAGRSFLGLGALLTDVQDFNELVSLAEKGDSSKVDTWMSGINVNMNDPTYKELVNSDNKVFAFGHAVGKQRGDFKPEDVAAALLSLIVTTIANEAHMWAGYHRLKHVIFGGGLVTDPFVRNELEKEFATRRFANTMGHMCDCSFMQHSGHLCAFGALLHNLGVSGSSSS